MDVLRGRAATPPADRAVTVDALSRAAEDGTTTLRVWSPHRQVAFGPRDALAAGYERAQRVASERGFRPIERRVGGRAVAYTGDTLAFAVAVPLDGASARQNIDRRYEIAEGAIRDALHRCDAIVVEGEPDAAFCPGARSLRVPGGGKLSGLAQRVTRDAALVAGCLVVGVYDAEELAGVLAPVYRALDVAFDPDSVGSVAAAGGSDEPQAVARALERAFVEGVWGDGTRRSKRVGSWHR